MNLAVTDQEIGSVEAAWTVSVAGIVIGTGTETETEAGNGTGIGIESAVVTEIETETEAGEVAGIPTGIETGIGIEIVMTGETDGKETGIEAETMTAEVEEKIALDATEIEMMSEDWEAAEVDGMIGTTEEEGEDIGKRKKTWTKRQQEEKLMTQCVSKLKR